MSGNLQSLREEIERAREKLHLAIKEKGSLLAAYKESTELDKLLERLIEAEEQEKEKNR